MTPFGDTKFHPGVSSQKTQKETSERKEGEEATVESQGKKKKKTFNSTAKERSAATVCLWPLLPLHKSHRSSARSLARSRAQSASATAPPSLLGPNLDLLYYVHAIEPSDGSHPLHRTAEDDGIMRSVLYKTYRIIYIHIVFYGALAVYGS
jgi:hypothetical protein